MNFFFGIKYRNFISNIQIPLFKNNSTVRENLYVFSAEIVNDQWKIKKEKTHKDQNFCYIGNENINNDKFFFLASDKDIINFSKTELINLNKYTDTTPAYRANLCIRKKESDGFSSYQSEYPFKMVEKKGSILSSIYSLTNVNADQNLIIFRNIYKYPIKEKFKGYIVNLRTKKILKEIELFTNKANFIKINNELIGPKNYIYTEKYLGIPIYLVEKKDDLSLEHTHPLHEYILDNQKYKLVSKIKKEFYEIVS